jgi:molybdopterin converting factor subunit 1
MIVQVRLFAGARQRVGRDQLRLELPAGATVGELRSQLGRQFEQLSDLLPHLMLALNHDYASDDEVIPANAEVAVIPPVSGG